MSVHPSANSLTVEVIEEYLEVAKICIAAKKTDGGIYGYPATLLLFCIINALGENLIGVREPFWVLKGEPFRCRLTGPQAKNLEKWYRNLLSHNGMIAPGTCLSPEDRGAPFDFVSDEPILIRVGPLYDLVRTAFERLDKGTLNAGWNCYTKPELFPEILNPVDFSDGSLSLPVAASGSNYLPPQAGGRKNNKVDAESLMRRKQSARRQPQPH